METARNGDRWRRAFAGARWVFGPLAMAFLAIAAWRGRNLVSTLIHDAEIGPLLFAVLLWALLHLWIPVTSRIILRESGTNLGYGTLLRIHVGRLPARYLPGGIWHTVSRVIDLHHLGVSRLQLSMMLVLENLLPVGVAAMLGGLFLCLAGNRSWLAWGSLIGGPLIVIATFFILKHRRLRIADGFQAGSYLKVVGVTTAFWLVAATAFYSYWCAFPAARGNIPTLELYGTYLISWVAGFIAVFAPQGIGVFESVAGLLLRGPTTFAGAAVLVAGFRVAILLADTLAFGILLAARVLLRSGHSQAVAAGDPTEDGSIPMSSADRTQPEGAMPVIRPPLKNPTR